MAVEALPRVRFDPHKVDQLGDKMVASIFLIAASWYPDKIVYPDADVWVGINLLALEGELSNYAPYLNARKQRP